MLSSHVFPGRETSGSSDRYLTTIKNSYKQGRLLGRALPFRLLSHFPERNLLFPTALRKRNYKSVSSTDIRHELKCFYSARHIECASPTKAFCDQLMLGLWFIILDSHIVKSLFLIQRFLNIHHWIKVRKKRFWLTFIKTSYLMQSFV